MINVRIHPRECLSEYNWISDRFPSVTLMGSRHDLCNAIEASDVVVSNRSAASHQAVMLQRRAVVVLLSEHAGEQSRRLKIAGDLVTCCDCNSLVEQATAVIREEGLYDRLLAREERPTREIIAPQRKQAAELTAEDIIDDLKWTPVVGVIRRR